MYHFNLTYFLRGHSWIFINRDEIIARVPKHHACEIWRNSISNLRSKLRKKRQLIVEENAIISSQKEFRSTETISSPIVNVSVEYRVHTLCIYRKRKNSARRAQRAWRHMCQRRVATLATRSRARAFQQGGLWAFAIASRGAHARVSSLGARGKLELKAGERKAKHTSRRKEKNKEAKGSSLRSDFTRFVESGA